MKPRVDYTGYDNAAQLLAVWGGTADIDSAWPKYSVVDPNDESWIKQLIRAEIVPNFLQAPTSIQKESIEGLKYLLSADSKEIEKVWNGSLVAFGLPDDPTLLPVWIRDVFEEHQIHLQTP